MTITALPTPPLRSDPTNFASRADAFLAALPVFQAEANELAVAMNLNATTSTSVSSVLIGMGAKTFTVSSGKSFQGGMFVVVADTAAPSTNSMVGQVTSYSGTALVVNVVLIKGSGTKTAWTISQSVPYATAIDGIPVGSGTPSTGSFTTLSSAGGVVLGKGSVIEAGRYIDFHDAGSGHDYDVRFDSGNLPGTAGGGNAVLTCGTLAITGPLLTPVCTTSNANLPAITSFSQVPLSATVGSYNLIASNQSNGSSFIQDNKWIVRGIGAAGWPSVRIHEGIGVDSSFLVPGSTTLAWYERGTDGTHKWGNANQVYGSLYGSGFSSIALKTSNGDVRIGNGGNSVDQGGSVLFGINDSIFGESVLPMSSVAGVLANFVAGELQGGISFRTRSAGDAGQVLTEKMRLDANGNFLVGTTSGNNPLNGFTLSISPGFGAIQVAHPTGTATGSAYSYYLYNGSQVGSITQSGTTAVAYNTTSDHRLKINVRPANAARFMDIEFVDFEWTDGRHDCGVIADQLQSVYPDLVLGEKDATEVRQVEITPAIPAVTDQREITPAVPTVYDGDQIVTMGVGATYETVEVTPAVPAVTVDQIFPVYQQVNYTGLIGRMGTRVQQLQRTVDAQAALIEALGARLTALESK